MLSRECNAASPWEWKTLDGRLWFPTNKGVVGIDPRQRNREPPQVNIESVRLDGAPLPLGEPVRIEPGRESLEIDYTALSWKRPQQIRFRYQLAGLDHDWVEAGTRRTAYYSHLPAGASTFRVIADNGEGVWNTEGKRLSVRVLPPFIARGGSLRAARWLWRRRLTVGLPGAFANCNANRRRRKANGAESRRNCMIALAKSGRD